MSKIFIVSATLLLVASLYSCNVSNTRSSATEDIINGAASAADTALAAPDPAVMHDWVYDTQPNKMTNDSNYYASVTAKDELQFDAPYDGGSEATIMVRYKEQKTNILLMVSKGQFNSSMDGATIRVKFDDGKPLTFSCSEPSDYDTKVLFVNNVQQFLSKLKNSSVVLVEAEFFNSGIRQMEFNTAGFNWNHK